MRLEPLIAKEYRGKEVKSRDKVCSTKKMVTVKICCGFGNQLYQYAFAYGLKQEKKQEVLLDALTYDAKYDREMLLSRLNISIPLVYRPRIPKIIRGLERYGRFITQRHIEERIRQVYDRELWKEITGNCYLNGYWQSYKYFHAYRDNLLKEFTYADSFSEFAERWMCAHAEKETVVVHIRRGDYVQLQNCLAKEYYLRAMDAIKEKVENPRFVFFSDDIEWVKCEFADVPNAEFFDNNGEISDLEEFFIMCSCKHDIIANSTFSWWVSYLNSNPEKIVIAPSINPEKDGDIYPPEYIVLDCEK